MPVKSKDQFRLVAWIRDQWKSKSDAPENKKWAFDPDWDLDKVNYDSLPEIIKKQEKLTPYKPIFEMMVSADIPQNVRPEQPIKKYVYRSGKIAHKFTKESENDEYNIL